MNINVVIPELFLVLSSISLLLINLFSKKDQDKSSNFVFIFSIVVSIILLYLIFTQDINYQLFTESFVSNYFTIITKFFIALLMLFVILISNSFLKNIEDNKAEFVSLIMFASAGGMVIVSAADLLTFYLGIELQSLSLYLLSAINKKHSKSSEASIKYFILGSVASAIFLFGITFVYGFSGSIEFYNLFNNIDSSNLNIGFILGFILIFIGMFFKISAAPFHMWSPDVYQGSASIVTTFFASSVKFASMVAFLKIYFLFQIQIPGIEYIIIFIVIASFIFGSFGAIYQKNFKRLLAYSSIANIGFFMLPLTIQAPTSFAFAYIYAIIYTVTSIGVFSFVNLVKKSNQIEDNIKDFDIENLSGIAKKYPFTSFSLMILFFSLAGIPPFAGFWSKFFIILSSLLNKSYFLAIFAIIFSSISAFYYLRIVKIIYFDKPNDSVTLNNDFLQKFVIILCAIFNLVAIIFFDFIIKIPFKFL